MGLNEERDYLKNKIYEGNMFLKKVSVGPIRNLPQI